MSHFQRGYAIVEFTYIFGAQRVDNTRAKKYDDRGRWIETENLQQQVPIQGKVSEQFAYRQNYLTSF